MKHTIGDTVTDDKMTDYFRQDFRYARYDLR